MSRFRKLSHAIWHCQLHLKRKPYWGNHFWARGYCVSTVGLDEQVIREYIKDQEREEKRQEQMRLAGL